jgi:uncharacterized OB-fold protein
MTEIANSPPDELFVLDTDMWTEPYWEACKEHRFTVAQCTTCGTFRIPPRPFCAHCNAQEIRWKPLSGRGEIYSFCVVNVAIVPAIRDYVPYVPAVVSLPDADNVRIITNIVDCPIDRIAIGKPVVLRWHDRADGVSVPRFTLEDSAA